MGKSNGSQNAADADLCCKGPGEECCREMGDAVYIDTDRTSWVTHLAGEILKGVVILGIAAIVVAAAARATWWLIPSV